MKLFVSLFLAFASVPAFANDLAILTAPKLVVGSVSEFTPVQPSSYLHFKYASCAESNFEVKTETANYMEGRMTKVTVVPQAFDCLGPTKLRNYSVQISSDVMQDGQYVLMNPSVLSN